MAWWNAVRDFFAEGTLANYILDGYLLFVVVLFLCWCGLRSKHFIAVMIPIVFVLFFWFLSNQFHLAIASRIFNYIIWALPILFVIIFAPDIHNWLDSAWQRNVHSIKGSEDDKQDIADAVMYLSSRKIGALITIEKHQILDSYAERAIVMNADISKELLINIFSPLTPLHDGAVIIKGNKIRCAGAYYKISQRDTLDKTVGSRHRAALGIAEVSDSITIVVSEETGKISITYSGIIITISDRDKLLEYIDLAME